MTSKRVDGIDFSINPDTLYREESFTDLQSGAVRRLVPVHADGSTDEGRTPVFIGTAQVLTPDGPLPIQAVLTANDLKDAIAVFPGAMQAALEEMIDQLEQMQRERPETPADNPRIVIPGRDF
ncbi:MAG: cytoplasmic protein [Desulfobacterales bacterium]|jgi:hypothetical protein|nr:cytoplasmic protein [Desulfobacteraceae bacterium]MDD3991871.1 cytoplasmic protein [Desulfobacteraceae bacterium]MDY0312661.1 cytoplasmic protein [Desulfobacterales bacterium]